MFFLLFISMNIFIVYHLITVNISYISWCILSMYIYTQFIPNKYVWWDWDAVRLLSPVLCFRIPCLQAPGTYTAWVLYHPVWLSSRTFLIQLLIQFWMDFFFAKFSDFDFWIFDIVCFIYRVSKNVLYPKMQNFKNFYYNKDNRIWYFDLFKW